MKTAIVSIAAVAAFLAGTGLTSAQQQEESTLTAEVVNAEGEAIGTVAFRQVEQGMVIVAELSDLPPGPHGFHIHESGVCDTPDFQSAGSHYNPEDKAHGLDNSDGYHAGDLANLRVHEDGTANAEIFSPLLTVAAQTEAGEGMHPLQTETGTAIMIHENADDYMDSDSAGGRIACGVIAEPQS